MLSFNISQHLISDVLLNALRFLRFFPIFQTFQASESSKKYVINVWTIFLRINHLPKQQKNQIQLFSGSAFFLLIFWWLIMNFYTHEKLSHSHITLFFLCTDNSFDFFSLILQKLAVDCCCCFCLVIAVEVCDFCHSCSGFRSELSPECGFCRNHCWDSISKTSDYNRETIFSI